MTKITVRLDEGYNKKYTNIFCIYAVRELKNFKNLPLIAERKFKRRLDDLHNMKIIYVRKSNGGINIIAAMN